MVTTLVNAPADAVEETWEMQVAGEVSLVRTVLNRMNNPVRERFTIGPNKIGSRFKISSVDRAELQEAVAHEDHDPFRNGILRRVDADQQKEEETASPNVMDAEEALALLDLGEEAFAKKLTELNEIACRKLLEIAQAAGASVHRVTALEDHIREEYRPGGPQKSMMEG